jgi:hypothetical protein
MAWLHVSIIGTSYIFHPYYEIDDMRLRFRQVPSYGNGVIRKFTNNTSEMKKLAARDFEDILQVSVCHFTHYSMTLIFIIVCYTCL